MALFVYTADAPWWGKGPLRNTYAGPLQPC